MMTSEDLCGLLAMTLWEVREMVRRGDLDPDVRGCGRGGHRFGRSNVLAACVMLGLRALGVSREARDPIYRLLRDTPADRLEADFAAGRRYALACPPNAVGRLLTADELDAPDGLVPDPLRPFGPVACVLDIGLALDVYRDRLDAYLARRDTEAGHALAAT